LIATRAADATVYWLPVEENGGINRSRDWKAI
jgi:hypothetical protein